MGPSAKNALSVKTGGLSWQWSIKTGFTVIIENPVLVLLGHGLHSKMHVVFKLPGSLK